LRVLAANELTQLADLDFIGVDPKHGRKGAGIALLAWGIEKAASEGRDLYLVATPAGRPLYLKAGFEECGVLNIFGVPHSQMIIKNDPKWKK
jgi:predicted GNAT family N-acyltransferase